MKLIETYNLEKNFRSVKAVDGVSLHVNEKEIFGPLGLTVLEKRSLLG